MPNNHDEQKKVKIRTEIEDQKKDDCMWDHIIKLLGQGIH